MTTRFVAPNWAGKTVAVFGGGPSFNTPLAESLREHITIAVNHVVSLVPWVDAMVALDGDIDYWKSVPNDYAGLKMCGVPSDDIDAMFIGSMYETIVLTPHHTVDVRNSGLAAIRIAARCGASRILLLGFDPDTYTHAVGYPIAPESNPNVAYPLLSAGLESVIASVRASGVAVEFVAPLPLPQQRKRST